jgi:outer membrane protein OmpA-like peptidoglycan-associated protein
MIRDDSRAHRFAKTWLGPLLATLVGIGSSVELAAMPIPAPRAQLLGPTLIQQSPGSHEAAQQPAGPPSAPASMAEEFIELHEALRAARERLSGAAEAVAANRQLQEERAALRKENQLLRADVEALTEYITALTKEVEQTAAKEREMHQELVAVRRQSEQRIAAAEAHAAELTKTVEQALQHERDDLRTQLANATARLGRSEAAKAQLESEVAQLREAARTTAGDTRQLIEALAAIGVAAGPLETDAALLAESGMPSAGEQAYSDEQAYSEGRAAAAPVEDVAAVAAPSQGPEPASADADLQRTETASVTRPGDGEGAHLDQRGILGGRPAVFPIVADLPREKRQHVQGLLADLHGKLDERGLMTTVPGELLFAWNSDEVRVGAYDTLAKVAELIGMYDNRQVLIIGHSDTTGDAARNRQLSERRAERVKQIFVESFEVAADRLSTEGQGDTRPIASNATPQGRRANRRVEVLILN